VQLVNWSEDINVYDLSNDSTFRVEGQEHGPIESRYLSGFFMLSVQVFVPSQGQELVPIAVKDKNIVRLPIR
jgi:hypothetical protein